MSRPRSGRGASPAGGGGNRPAAQRGVYVQTPKSDIFVVLLGVALGAMVLGCLLLVLVLNQYGFKTKVSALSPAPRDALAMTLPGGLEKISTVRL